MSTQCPRCAAPFPKDSVSCTRCGLQLQPSSFAKKSTISTPTALVIALVSMCGMCGVIGMIGAAVDSIKNGNAGNTGVASTKPSPTPTPTPSFTPTPKPVPSPSSSETPDPYPYIPELMVTKSAWRKGGFENVALWYVTIKNRTDKKLGDIKFRTAYFSETGNDVGKGGVDGWIGKDTIEKYVPPKSSRTFEVNDGFVNDEAVRGKFEIVSWRVIP